MMRKLLVLTVLAVLLCGCRPDAEPAPTTAETTLPLQVTEATIPTTLPPETEPPDPLDLLMSQMTLREKVGQLFMVAPEALETDPDIRAVTELSDTMDAALKEYPVGGLILFYQNIESPEQLSAFNRSVQYACKIPMFIGVDEEGGLVTRLASHPAFDLPKYRNAAAVGASGNSLDALEMGRTIGAYLKQYDFNLDFAPVADVNTNPYNPVIGTRSFSTDPEIAAAMSAAMAAGLNEHGIIAVFKHFPGHGDTAQDSHKGIAVTDKNAEEMASCEWLPFLEAGSGDLVMIGHIAAPQITGDFTPATLSYRMVTEILKQQLGFSGLVITDSMQMGAITNSYTSAEAAVLALQAGCHIILMPQDFREAFDAVAAAVEDGTLSPEWLDETVRKILELKQSYGIIPSE